MTSVAIAGGEVRRNGAVLATGRVLDAAELAEQLAEQRARIDSALMPLRREHHDPPPRGGRAPRRCGWTSHGRGRDSATVTP